MAPEILKFQKYDAKADLWSVGTILYEMVVGKPPYGGSNHVQLLANIERTDLRFPPTIELSSACKSLLLGLLQRKPVTRMGFDEFFNHPFVGLRELSQSASAAMSLSASHAPMSIREEDEDAEDEAPSTKERAASESLENPSPSSSALRQSRSGNMEVMQTVFGSTSSAGSPALRRSSRLGRSRRATSSGAILVNQQQHTSPKLSPQMSPHMLPSPSPRINPFKQMGESPPSALHASTHLRTSGGSSQSSQRLSRPVPAVSAPTNSARPAKSGALDSSDEYVLVESGEKASTSSSNARDVAVAGTQPSHELAHKLRSAPAFSHEYGQQLVDIVMLRTQAIAPIAEQLWKLSAAAANTVEAPSPQQRDSTSGSGANLASMFSMESSSLSSSGGANASSHLLLDDDESSSSYALEKKQYACAAEALALYVKCLRIVQHGIAYLRQDAAAAKRLTASPAPVPWSEASRKLSMAYLMEQLSCFLDRAEQCKKRMASALASADAAVADELQRVAVSHEELLYAHAIRLGKQGAVKEVLGQTRVAYEHYLQSMLLLESLLMDSTAPSATAVLAIDDQKSVNAFLRALDERLQNVKRLLQDDSESPLSTQRAVASGATAGPP